MIMKNSDIKYYGRDIKGDNIEYNGETYRYLSRGITRTVFVDDAKTKVIKVPNFGSYEIISFLANRVEDAVFNQLLEGAEKGLHAECHLIENGWLMMEYVEAELGSKGRARGKSKNGIYKYFDYGDYMDVENELDAIGFDKWDGEFD